MTSAPSGTLSSPLLLLLQEKHPHRISKSSKPTSLPTGRQKLQYLHWETYYVVGTRLPTLTLPVQESLFRPLFQLLPPSPSPQQTAETGTSGTACVSQPEDGELATLRGAVSDAGKVKTPPPPGNAKSSAPLVPPGAELAPEPRGASSLTLLGGWRCSPSGLLQETCHSGPPLRLMDERELHAPHPAPRKSDIASTLTPRAEDCKVRREAAQRQRLCLWSEKGLLPKARQGPLLELCRSWRWEESHPSPA